MSDSIPSREGSGLASTRGSARLGLTLRAVLVSPEIGFSSAIKSADRRARAGKRPAEGIYPYVLAGAGGASWFLLWLKVGGLTGLRDASGEAFELAYLAVAVVLGAILGLSAQAIWSGLAVRASHVDRRSLRRDLRIAWGAAALPQLVALVALTPLDLAVVGSAIYTTDPMADPVSTAWSAFSIAVAGALAAWNVYLLARGSKVGLEIGSLRTAFVTGAALLILTLAFAPVIVFSAVTT